MKDEQIGIVSMDFNFLSVVIFGKESFVLKIFFDEEKDVVEELVERKEERIVVNLEYEFYK